MIPAMPASVEASTWASMVNFLVLMPEYQAASLLPPSAKQIAGGHCVLCEPDEDHRHNQHNNERDGKAIPVAGKSL